MSRFLFAFLLIAFCIVGYFAYTVFSKREGDLTNTNMPSTKEQPNSITNNTPTESQNTDNSKTSTDATKNETADATTTPEKSNEESFYVHVTATDCARECEPYKYNDKEMEYCKNVCGISEESSGNDCDKLKALDKDYCYKNQAIEKKDMSLCDNISDSAIKKTCKNRLQEDVLENM